MGLNVTFTPSGLKRIGPQHKSPHFGRPFFSHFYSAFLNGKKPAGILISLGDLKKQIKPFFSFAETEELIKEEVFNYYAREIKLPDNSLAGRYQLTPPQSRTDWEDLINNIANLSVARRGLIPVLKQRKEPLQNLVEMIGEWQVGIRKLKIIEDYFYYHPEKIPPLERHKRNLSGNIIDKTFESFLYSRILFYEKVSVPVNWKILKDIVLEAGRPENKEKTVPFFEDYEIEILLKEKVLKHYAKEVRYMDGKTGRYYLNPPANWAEWLDLLGSVASEAHNFAELLAPQKIDQDTFNAQRHLEYGMRALKIIEDYFYYFPDRIPTE